jgi:hypothetical protein
MRNKGKCGSCGHKGGAREAQRSDAFDAIAVRSGLDPLVLAPTLSLCAGRLFDVDGPVECLRRSMAGAR